jgi:uncharacterized membrane protein
VSRDALVLVVWACHGTLLGAVSLGLLTSSLPVAARAVLAAGLALPLLAALPGLRKRRRYTYQWLAFALVAYSGGAAVEVVATSGRSPFASTALLAALIELAILYTLNRPSPPRESHE